MQRLLGRCLIRLQQYESLLKALLIDHDIGGPVSDLHARQRRNAEFFGTSTLGQLAGEVFDRVIVVDGVESEPESDDLSTPTEDAIWFRFQRRVDADEHVRRKAHLKSLVDLRNDLVHHLIQTFDLWSDDRCEQAQEHLAMSYDTIDGHYGEHRALVQAFNESRSRVRALLESEQWHDFLVDGIDPNGPPDWPHTKIVRALQEVHRPKGLRSAEWMPLTQAVEWIRQHHPDQTP